MINWLDLVFLFIIILFGLRGGSSGLFTGIINIAGLIGSFWAASHYYTQVARWLADEWGWADSLASLIKPLVKLPEPFNNPEVLSLPVKLLNQISRQIPLPSPWPDIIGYLNQLGPNRSVGEAMNLLLAQGLLKMMVFIGIFLVARAALKFIGAIFIGILSFTPLGPVNRLGGLGLGLAAGIILVGILITILVPLQIPLALMGAQGVLSTLNEGIRTSIIINTFSPLVKEWKVIPNLFPELNANFLKQYFHFGTEV